MSVKRLGIIGGTGWLGGGLAEAVVATGFIAPEALLLSSRSGTSPLAGQGVRVVSDNRQLVDECEVIVLSIRPEQFADVHVNAAGKTLVSFMAGVPAAVIGERTGATHVIRAMPNAAVEIRQSFTPWYSATPLDETLQACVQRLLECVGTAAQVPDEHCIDYLSALSGTGPAYPALLAVALTRQAVAAGIPPAIAEQAALGVVKSSAPLLGSRSPQGVIDALMAYRGVTAAGLESMMAEDFEGMVGRALQAGAEVAKRGM